MTKIKQMLCALLTVCLLFIGSTNAMAAQTDTPSISVSANATIEVTPDTAVISFDVNGKGRTAAEATSASAAKMDSVKHNLLGCNILGNDITTTSYTLYPDTDIKGKITGYTASNSVRIKLKDIGKLGPVIDKISAAGVDTINNISFSVSNRELYRNKLLAQAVENARQQAAVVANAGGRTLGKLLSANISTYSGGMERSYGNMKLMAAADRAAAPETSIAAQEITIKASVDTVFAME